MIAQILLLAALVGQPMHGRGGPAHPGRQWRAVQPRQGWNASAAFWVKYGGWREVPTYGRVWVPRVWRGWRPYYYGVWVQFPSWGIGWSSYEPWGSVCYHYGRWVWLAGIGWAWVPGNQWGPAWVDWYDGPDYYSWAPLGPDDRPVIYGGSPIPGEPLVQGGIAWVTVSKNSFTRGNYQYLDKAPGRDVVGGAQPPVGVGKFQPPEAGRAVPPRAVPPRAAEPRQNGMAPGPVRTVYAPPPEVVRQLPQRDDKADQPKRDQFQRQWQQNAEGRNPEPMKGNPGNSGRVRVEQGRAGPGKTDR